LDLQKTAEKLAIMINNVSNPFSTGWSVILQPKISASGVGVMLPAIIDGIAHGTKLELPHGFQSKSPAVRYTTLFESGGKQNNKTVSLDFHKLFLI